MQNPLELKKNNVITLNFIAFLLAFCSISYQIIIASKLSRILGEGITVYPLCIAIFILFMGLGSAQWFNESKTMENQSLRNLLSVEFRLTFFGFISIMALDLLLYKSLYIINFNAIILGIFFTSCIGFLSGQELPLLFHFCSHLNFNQKDIRKIIFFDYCASFFASVVCTLFLFPNFGFLKSSIFVSFANILVVILLLFVFIINKIKYPKFVNFLIPLILVFYIFFGFKMDAVENRILKRSFVGDQNAVILNKFYTQYQQVLLFLMRKDYAPIEATQEEILSNTDDYYLFASLNGSLQFFEPFATISDPDHYYLLDPFLYLNPSIKNILILGGGDGLPTREAIKYKDLEKITVIDLDKQWVNFAKENPYMRKHNNASFDDPRVELHFMDAFKWIIQTKDKYDLIIVDFPAEPNSLAAKRTVSIQFFRDLKRILTPEGVAILHTNGTSNPLRLQLYSKTADEAGLTPLFGYKQDSDTWSAIEQILLFTNENYMEEFIDNYVTNYLTNQNKLSILEKFGYVHYGQVKEANHWVSFYDPFVSKLPLIENLTLFGEELSGR